jgi:hypothetical protein
MAGVDKYVAVAREVDLLVAEAATLNAEGPQFVIGHRYCKTPFCAPGEAVDFVALRHRGRLFFMHLSASERVLFEGLSRLRWSAVTATQLSAFLRTDEFFKKHGQNADRKIHVRGVSRKSLRVNIGRVRGQMGIVFAEAGLALRPEDVLRTERTSGPIGYQLHGFCQVVHIDGVGCNADAAVAVDDFVAGASGAFHIPPTPSTTLKQVIDSKRIRNR